MSQKWVKLLGLYLVFLLGFGYSNWVQADVDDVIQKQKKLEQEKNEEKTKAKAISSRSLEIFNIIASVVEELNNKGVNFEKINTLNRGGEEVYIWGPDWYLPVITQQLNYKIVLIGEYLNDPYGLMPQYKIIIEPKGGSTCYIKILNSWPGRETPSFNEEKELGLEMSIPFKENIIMIIPIYGTIENKKVDLRKNAMKLIEKSMK